ncbi:uncharacterized protein DEA37_0007832 [Paragonimus westermani]|uniref:Uncharacterized protein n=1 Tax=Paragonimus westermani TaxID=34504 RepID=A0A5J4NCY2_9TREM|nr:uncharacterized protein DEA37_0007832 [Paragonimus westermani]
MRRQHSHVLTSNTFVRRLQVQYTNEGQKTSDRVMVETCDKIKKVIREHVFPKPRFIIFNVIDFRRHLSFGPEFALMRIWNGMVRRILLACQQIGPRRCMTVRYELLVLDPERMMRHVFGSSSSLQWDSSLKKYSS